MARKWQAGARASLRVTMVAAALTVAGASALAGCSDGPNPFQAASSTTVAGGTGAPSTEPDITQPATDGTSTDGVGENEFIPDRNLSDCVGALERPNCGSKEKGGLGTYLVFLALILGVGFIMWRIARGVKARDAVVNAPQGPSAPAPATGDARAADAD